MHEPSRLGATIRSRRKGRLQPSLHLTNPAGQLCLPNPLHRLAVSRPLRFRRAKRLPSSLTMQPKWCPFVLRTTTRDNPHRRSVQPRPHQRGDCSTQARRPLPLRQLRPKLSGRLGQQMQSSRLLPALYQEELYPRHHCQLRPVWRRQKRPYPCPRVRPRHRMRRQHPPMPLNPTVRIRAQVVMLFPRRLHLFWPLWRGRRDPHPCRRLRHRQRRTRWHHPHLPPN
jgi:hypothetical protein